MGLNDYLKGITKINNIFKLFDFEIKKIRRNYSLGYDKNQRDEIFNKLKKYSDEVINEFNKKGKLTKDVKDISVDLIKYLDWVINNLKGNYITKTFKTLRYYYNNEFEMKTENFNLIEEVAYDFISTRITWGLSWFFIKQEISKAIKKTENNMDSEDFMKYLTILNTTHERISHKVFIPIKGNINNVWIENFQDHYQKINFVKSNDLLKLIENKSLKNIHSISSETVYLSYNTKQMDVYAAIEEVLGRMIPQKLGLLSIFSRNIDVDKDSKIIVTANWTKKQAFFDFSWDKIIENELFYYDFNILPELKYKNILSNTSKAGKYNEKMSELMATNYLLNKKNNTEDKSIAVSTTLENLTSIVREMGIEIDSKKYHHFILSVVMIDINIEFYINNSLAFRKTYEKEKKRKFKNDLEFLEFFLLDQEWKSCKTPLKFNQWLHTNTFLNESKENYIFTSLEWFKNYSIQSRNKFAHEGKKLDFFSRLSIETTDSILSLAVIRLINKKIYSKENWEYQKQNLKKLKKQKTFELLKKNV